VILGIDLGTTFCAVAVMAPDGRAQVLPNALGELTTPSCVYFESASEAVVGALAKSTGAHDPDNTVTLIKRRMGTEYPLEFHGVAHTPESISAVLLRALVADARAGLGISSDKRGISSDKRGISSDKRGISSDERAQAVITVPAYFGTREREATAQAAVLAGVDVLELISEPVAAALHYGASDGTPRRVLVYDLGGGTFDCTVLQVGPDGVRVVATDGDSHLGGADVDQRVADLMLSALSAATPPEVDPREDEGLMQEVLAAAEAAKRALSSRVSHAVTLRYHGASTAVVLDRTRLEELTADLLQRTLAIVDRLLVAAGSGDPISEVMLVGGSSRMPVVASALRRRLGLIPRLVEPELAVALGAAVRADQLMRDSDGQAVSVLPRSVGVLVRDSTDPAGLREFVHHVLSRNTPLPVKATVPFATILDKQRQVRIQVFEQAGAVPSAELSHNRRVLDGELTGLPELPAGSRIDVTLGIGLDGRLMVTAREPGNGCSLQLDAYIEGVIDADLGKRLASGAGAVTIRH
jgi:molecular chaperone DnaK